MTREEIEAKWEGMTPRERDAWIATDVMGYERVRENDSYVRKNNMATLPKPYSSEMSAAWEVLEKFQWFSIKKYITVGEEERYFVHIEHNEYQDVYSEASATCKTAPEAIGKTSLLAVLEG